MSLSADLIEARLRISNLEANGTQDRLMIKDLSAQLAASSMLKSIVWLLDPELSLDLDNDKSNLFLEVKTLMKDLSTATTNVIELELRKAQEEELAAAKATSLPPPGPCKGAFEDSSVVVNLQADITRLRNELEEWNQKSNTIEERYKNNDLVCPCPLTFAKLLTE